MKCTWDNQGGIFSQSGDTLRNDLKTLERLIKKIQTELSRRSEDGNSFVYAFYNPEIHEWQGKNTFAETVQLLNEVFAHKDANFIESMAYQIVEVYQ